eukprot:jgi/Mesvir1/544/Mv11400-RA.3
MRHAASGAGDARGEKRFEELPAPPEDRYYLCYLSFFLLGLGTLFPWNAFITAQSYYQARFSNFLIMPLVIRYHDRLRLATAPAWAHARGNDVWLEAVRIACPLLASAGIFVTMMALAYDDALAPDTLYRVTLASIVLLGFTTSLLQCGIYGLASRFPPIHLQATMVGQSSAGLTIGLSAVLTAALSRASTSQPSLAEVRPAAIAYFAVAVAITLACLGAFVVLAHLEYARCYASDIPPAFSAPPSRETSREWSRLFYPVTAAGDLAAPLLPPGTRPPAPGAASRRGSWHGEDNRKGVAVPAPAMHACSSSVSLAEAAALVVEAAEGVDLARKPRGARPQHCVVQVAGHDTLRHLLRRVAAYVAAIWLVFFVSLSVFPSLVSAMRPVNHTGAPGGATGRLFNNIFVPLLFLVFNGGDMAGRLLSAVMPAAWERCQGVLRALRVRWGRVPLTAPAHTAGSFHPCHLATEEEMEPELHRSPLSVLAAPMARLALVPLFLLCHFQWDGDHGGGSAVGQPWAAQGAAWHPTYTLGVGASQGGPVALPSSGAGTSQSNAADETGPDLSLLHAFAGYNGGALFERAGVRKGNLGADGSHNIASASAASEADPDAPSPWWCLRGLPQRLPPWLHHALGLSRSNAFAILLVLVLGLTNGYQSASIMMHFTLVLDLPEDKDLASGFLVCALTGGLAAGSLASYGLRALACCCNPFS